MLRAIYLLIRLFFFFIFVEPRFWKIKRLEKEGNVEEKDKILIKTIREFNNIVFGISNVKIIVEGSENIPPVGTSFVVTPNHSSFFDIPLILFAFDRVIGFVSKKENGKIPFVGRWITVFYSVFIDRTSAREAIKSMSAGVEIIKAGHPQTIFPSGTRSIDGKVNEFKAGSYKLAQKSNVPVLPVAIAGAYKVLPKGSLKVVPSTVKIKIFEPLDSSTLSTNEMAEISQKLISDYIENAFLYE